jgi:3-hydroxyisobutyrate dehydrogenase-like beta-hydroxyacid dehydrogenase
MSNDTMAARLLAAGQAVAVWNRTPQLAEPLVDQVHGRE